jgi:hypothetical protein
VVLEVALAVALAVALMVALAVARKEEGQEGKLNIMYKGHMTNEI